VALLINLKHRSALKEVLHSVQLWNIICAAAAQTQWDPGQMNSLYILWYKHIVTDGGVRHKVVCKLCEASSKIDATVTDLPTSLTSEVSMIQTS
jgi:hypothetical protein